MGWLREQAATWLELGHAHLDPPGPPATLTMSPAARAASLSGRRVDEAAHTTCDGFRHAAAYPLGIPDMGVRDAWELDYELADLADLTTKHGPLRAAQLMNWSRR